ncbi:family 1 glycosylhydrolase [Sphaerisporangium sp. NPDC004334]
MPNLSAFLRDFLWGASSVGHQIEGGNLASDFWEMEHAPGTVFAEPSGDACDGYHRWREDVGLLAGIGLNAYRFSLEWSRVEPEEGRFSRAAIDHYRCVVEGCHEREHLTRALRALKAAMDDGADVRGYFHWSLLDSFEWLLGHRPTFGLIAVDRATFGRTVKPSAHVYGAIARGGRLPGP